MICGHLASIGESQSEASSYSTRFSWMENLALGYYYRLVGTAAGCHDYIASKERGNRKPKAEKKKAILDGRS